MARKKARERRLKFFGLGNTRCPICLVHFSEEGVRKGRDVTLEHVPPKALGGQEVCLTCEACNSRASATSDQAVKRSKSAPALLFDVKGTKRSAQFWPEGIPASRMPYGFGPGAAAQEAKRELEKETIVAVTQPIEFNQSTTIKQIYVSMKSANKRYVELSYLRSAYLLVFSLLGKSGYAFAESEALAPVRGQILNPDDEAGSSLVRSFGPGSQSGNIITLRANDRPFFWSVKFDDGTCVILPYGGCESEFRRIAKLGQHLAIGGWEWKSRKFGDYFVDRHGPLRRKEAGEIDLFGREYVTVSKDGNEQRWVVVAELGDAMPAGPSRARRAEVREGR